MTIHSEVSRGIDFKNLSSGWLVEVETTNRRYLLECLNKCTMRISGHPEYCLSPMLAMLQGSIDDQGAIGTGMIHPGMHLTYFLDQLGPVAASRVVRVQVTNSDRAYSLQN